MEIREEALRRRNQVGFAARDEMEARVAAYYARREPTPSPRDFG